MVSLGLQRGTVELKDHDPQWHALFKCEKKILLEIFGDRIIAIEHIGSTSICGISAKPIIDMNVAVTSLRKIDDFIEKLPNLGYEYMPERRFKDRQFFPKGPRECRTHHLNLTEMSNKTGWKGHLVFRDYLRKNKDAREEYDTLKKKLAEQYSDNREKYTHRKADFIQDVINRK